VERAYGGTVKAILAIGALLAMCLAFAGSAEATKKHRRPFCSSFANTQVLKHNRTVRILYIQHPDQEDIYGIPATVYACFPARKRRTKLFEIPSSEVWTHKIMRLNDRYFAFAATTEDIVCEKYMQPDCTGAYVQAFRVANGAARCGTSVFASALALTSGGWIAWLPSGSQPLTLSACDSAGSRTLDQGTIDPKSVRALGTSVQWTRDGQSRSAELR
jgi:hypothetical protein